MSAVPAGREPAAYGEGKRAKVRGDASSDVGRWVRAGVGVFGDVPVAAWLGVCANGSVGENTTGWRTGDAAERAQAAQTRRLPLRASPPYDPNNRDDWANKGFHELGSLGVEGGSARGLCPGRGEHDSWLKLAVDDGDASYNVERSRVRRVLGRNAVTAPGAWVAIADSIVLGMANNCRCARMVRAGLPEALRWEVDADGYPVRWSAWSFAAGTMGWSAGVGGARHHLSIGAEVVARAPEAERWGVWLVELVSRGITAGQSHSNVGYSALRTCQKFEAGAVAAEFTGEPGAPAWLRRGLPESERASIYQRLAAGVYGASGAGGSSGSAGGGGVVPTVTAGVGRAVVGGLAAGLGSALRVVFVGGALVLVVGLGRWWWMSRAEANALGLAVDAGG